MMKKSTIIRIALVVATCAAVLGVTTGAVFGSMAGSSSSSSRVPALTGQATRVATYAMSKDYAVFVQRDGNGNVCFLSGPSSNTADRRGGCNPASVPLVSNKMLTLYTFDGGPTVQSVTNARVAGLVSPSVTKVVLVMSDGSTQTAALVDGHTGAALGSNYNTFASDLSDADYAAGISLAGVVGYNSANKIVQHDNYDNVLPK